MEERVNLIHHCLIEICSLIWHWLKALDVAEIHIFGKTFWDWITAIGGPCIIAIGGFIGGLIVNSYLKDRDDKQREQDKEIEEDRLRQDTLINYFDQMSQLLLNKDWPKSTKNLENNNETYKKISIINLTKKIYLYLLGKDTSIEVYCRRLVT